MKEVPRQTETTFYLQTVTEKSCFVDEEGIILFNQHSAIMLPAGKLHKSCRISVSDTHER